MSPLIATHALLAMIALVCGGVALWARRQNAARPTWHRFAGYGFVISMFGTASTAFFIRSTGDWSWHGFTPIHLLIPLAVAGIARAFWYLRHRNFVGHRRVMQMVYVGGCVIAGLFTLTPDRIIGRWLWSSLGVI